MGDTLNPLSQNRYTYCHNNPVMYDDPSGHLIDIRDTVKGTFLYSLHMLKENM